jgi:signal peptidase II
LRVFFLTFAVVIIDQLTKLKVKGIDIPFLNFSIHGMPYNSSINVIDNLFLITFIENPGMAFGIEFGGKLLLSIFTLIATVLIIYFILKHKNESLYLRLSLAFILGGAVGNLIDRLFYGLIYGYAPLFYGKVVDFFHVNIPDFTILGRHFYTFPIFNVADISVTIGFLMILFGYRKIFKTSPVIVDTKGLTETVSDDPVPAGNDTDINPNREHAVGNSENPSDLSS